MMLYGKMKDNIVMPMPRYAVVDGVVVENASEARADWRRENGWKPVVTSDSVGSSDGNGKIIVSNGFLEINGVITEVVRALAWEEMTEADKMNIRNISDLTTDQKDELLGLLLARRGK